MMKRKANVGLNNLSCNLSGVIIILINETFVADAINKDLLRYYMSGNYKGMDLYSESIWRSHRWLRLFIIIDVIIKTTHSAVVKGNMHEVI